MTTEVWIEWQAKWGSDPFGERRADLRNAMLIEHTYKAAFMSVGRVVGMFSDKGDQFDYDALPKYPIYMPYLTEAQRDELLAMIVSIDRYDAPFDPNQMEPADYEAMFGDVRLWQEFLGGVDSSVRIVEYNPLQAG